MARPNQNYLDPNSWITANVTDKGNVVPAVIIDPNTNNYWNSVAPVIDNVLDGTKYRPIIIVDPSTGDPVTI